MADLNKRIIDLTTGELLNLIAEAITPKVVVDTTKEDRRYVYGLAGIAGLFGCSKTTANRIKQSGKIDKAITQIGNKIIIDADKAIELAGKVNSKYIKKQAYVKQRTD
jgi:hypothetical protein